MCDPVTIGIATFALQATSAISTHIGTNQAYKANEQAANLSYARDMDAVGRQDSQLQQERSQSVLDTAIAALGARGDIAASAADSGLATTSLSHQINAKMFGLGRDATVEDINFRNQRVELAESRTDAQLRRQGQINSRSKSSIGQLALGVAEAGLAGVNAASGTKPKAQG